MTVPEQLGLYLLRQCLGVRRPHGRVLPAPVHQKQPDLNWENPQVRQAVYDLMNWWLDRGVDGFRMDVINLISKHATLPDGQQAPGELYGDGSPYYSEGPRVHEFLQEMHRAVFADRDAELLTVGETPGVSVEQAPLHRPGSARTRHGLPVRARGTRPRSG